MITMKIDNAVMTCYDKYNNRIITCHNRDRITALSLDSGQVTELLSGGRYASLCCNNRGDILVGHYNGYHTIYTLITQRGQRYQIHSLTALHLTNYLLVYWGVDPTVTIPDFDFVKVTGQFYEMTAGWQIAGSDPEMICIENQLEIIDFKQQTKTLHPNQFNNNYGVYLDYYGNFISCNTGQIDIYSPDLVNIDSFDAPHQAKIYGKYLTSKINGQMVLNLLPYTIWSPSNHKFHSRFHPEIRTMMTLSTIVSYLNLMPIELWSLIFSEF